MTASDIAKALLTGITADTFLAEVRGGWLYEAEYAPPQAGLGFAVGYDVKISLVSPTGGEIDVYVYKPRPLAPTETMCMKSRGGAAKPVEEFQQWLLDVLTDVARDACDKAIATATGPVAV